MNIHCGLLHPACPVRLMRCQHACPELQRSVWPLVSSHICTPFRSVAKRYTATAYVSICSSR